MSGTSTSSTSTTSSSTSTTSTSTSTTTSSNVELINKFRRVYIILFLFLIFTLLATTTTSFPCGSCVNKTWISSTNRLAQWLFDGNYRDVMNNYNTTPANSMSFTSYGYVNQAIIFTNNTSPMLNVPYIPLSNTSFTIDTWLYITGLQNIYDHGIFGLCSQIAAFKCMHLTFRLNNGNYHLYFGFYLNDCEGITALTLNTWIHAAFVFDYATLTQKIYLNGVLENSCTQSSGLTVTPTSVTIGYLPLLASTSGGVGYFQVNDFFFNS